MLAVAVAAAGTLLAGCTSTASTSALSAQQVAERYGYDESTATLSPVYALVPQFKDPKDGYARDLLAHQCLTGVVDYRVVVPGTTQTLTDERTGQLAFDAEIAAQWGYPQLHEPASVDSAVPDGVTITPEIQDAMVACGHKADERLGSAPQRLLNGIEGAGWDAIDGDEGVQKAIAEWRTCMAPAGVVDLPDGPHEMPSESVMTAGSVTKDAQGNLQGNPGSVASDREKQVAVLDAQCRDQSGFTKAEFHARVQAELTAIGLDIDGFEASRVAYEAYDKKLDAVITELG